MNTQAKPAPAIVKVSAAPAVAKPAGKKLLKKAPTKVTEVSGKLGKLVTLMKRPKGATLADLMRATEWQAHSVRGAISGGLKKKLKLAVLSEKTGSVRTYRIKA